MFWAGFLLGIVAACACIAGYAFWAASQIIPKGPMR